MRNELQNYGAMLLRLKTLLNLRWRVMEVSRLRLQDRWYGARLTQTGQCPACR